MSTIEIADRYYWFASADTTKSSLIRIVKSLWNDIAQDSSSSVKCKKRAEQLMQTIGPVVNSRPAEMVFLKNIKQVSKAWSQIAVWCRVWFVSKAIKGLAQISTGARRAGWPYWAQCSYHIYCRYSRANCLLCPKKKRKYLKPIDLRASTPSERIKTLATY